MDGEEKPTLVDGNKAVAYVQQRSEPLLSPAVSSASAAGSLNTTKLDSMKNDLKRAVARCEDTTLGTDERLLARADADAIRSAIDSVSSEPGSFFARRL